MKKAKHNPSPYRKVAFIGNYKTSCGISTYNEDLTDSFMGGAMPCEFKFFAEYAEDSESEHLNSDPSWLVRCWSRKEHPKLNLIEKILEYEPDIVHISHEYGIFPQAYYFTSLVSVLKGYGIKVLTTFHSVYEHADKAVTENAPDIIIVHTIEAKLCLMRKGIWDGRIKVIPHGTPTTTPHGKDIELISKDWNTWHSEHTLFHAGFMFEYKGHGRMMHVVAKLKEKYPDIHYVIQGSESERHMAEHDEVYHKLIRLSKDLGIEHNVTINRGFVETRVLMSHIRTVKCCVLPYVTHPQHDVRATSGIARLILTTETPLVVSDVHLFDDIKDIADVAHNDDELYDLVDKVFASGGLTDLQKKKRLDFLRTTSWGKIGEKTLSLYKSTTL